jgi:hypothetical protein
MDLDPLCSNDLLMDADEREICMYLKGFLGQFVSYAEISRRAGGKQRFRQEPEWATPVLARMVERGIIESDSTGHYKLKSRPRKDRTTRFVSPQIRKILEGSGKNFEGVFEIETDEEDFTKE